MLYQVEYEPTADPNYWVRRTYKGSEKINSRWIPAREVPHDIRFGSCQRLVLKEEFSISAKDCTDACYYAKSR